jgi:hypothetical protein
MSCCLTDSQLFGGDDGNNVITIMVIIGNDDVLISVEALQMSHTNCRALTAYSLDHTAAVVCQITC